MTTERVINPADPANTSESEEMYLITVARAAEDGRTGPLPVAMLAAHLQVSVASTNEMVRKLAARDLLTYEPYRGVQLTPLGAEVSERVLRTRRLWSTFLASHLGLSPTEADDQACLLEHVTMPEATDRLASFLGDPATGPLGHRIPTARGSTDTPPAIRIIDLAVGTTAEVIAITGSEQGRVFLAGEGIKPGAAVLMAGAGDTAVLVEVEGALVTIGRELATKIEVQPTQT